MGVGDLPFVDGPEQKNAVEAPTRKLTFWIGA
jgi:hypothetical protein